MESNYLIRLSANASSPVKTGIKLKQGDSGQTLSLTVEGINTASTTAKIAFKRPNGAVSVESSITAVNGVYNYTLQGNELGELGLVVADLKFYEGTKRVSTASFIFEVLPDTMDGIHTPTAKVDKTLMEQYLDEMTVLNQQTASSASAAQASASIAQVAATQLTAASTGRLSNENLLDNPFFTVNQRQGFMTKDANVVYYSDAALTQPQQAIGWIATSSANKLHKVSDTTWSFGDNGEFYVKASDVVSGYVGNYIYTADRWITGTPKYVKTFPLGGVELQADNDAWALTQVVDLTGKNLDEKTVTFSIDVAQIKEADGDQWRIFLGYGADEGSTRYVVADFDTVGIHSQTVTLPANTRFIRYGIHRIGSYNAASSIKVKAVKLELGSVSTLANDVAPNYAEELAKCQRYFQRIKLSRALCMIRNQSGCKLWVPISLPMSMRVKTPSISNAKINAWVYHSGTSWDSNVSINSATVMVDGDESHIAVDVALTNPLTNYTNGSLGCCASFEADLSADL